MKIFNCVCEFGHAFEGWFDSVESLDEQLANHWVSCPHCESTNVKRVPSAPHVQGFRDKEKAHSREELIGEVRRQVYQMARAIVKDSEDVGDRFVTEARAVHAGTAPNRTIHGRCTLADAKELLEEGIDVLPLPEGVVRKTN